MKTLKVAVVLAALPLAAAAQDVLKVDPAHYKVLIDSKAPPSEPAGSSTSKP
jgi:hypothetical protein